MFWEAFSGRKTDDNRFNSNLYTYFEGDEIGLAGKEREKPLEDEKNILVPASEEDDIPEEFEAIMEELPAETKKRMHRMMVQEFGMIGISQASQESAIAKKITPEHITEYLGGAREQMQKEYTDRFHQKLFITIWVVVALLFFFGVMFLFKESPDEINSILIPVATFLAGIFGGYGVGRRKSGTDD